MGRLIWFSQTLCLCFMLLHFRVQSSSPSQSSLDSPSHLCRLEERSALLDFKSTTNLEEDFTIGRHIIQTWNKSIDCCLWEGITCDKPTGHVIGLDLSGSCLEANLTTNSSLFHLEKLQSLNLAFNYFDYPSISFGFHRWKSLKYLDLKGYSGHLDGSLLFEISLLEKLVSLDLSHNYGLHLDSKPFQTLVHNLTELRFLNLDYVNMSLVAPFSFLNLTSSLEHLSVSHCNLQGNFSSQVFHLSSLQLLDLSFNNNLSGNLPESNWSSPLKYLYLEQTSFSGELPRSIGNLKLLVELDLTSCQFYGSIPKSLANLTEITSLDFSSNHLQGHIPDVFGKMQMLTQLSFYSNNFGGEIPASIFNLTSLTFLLLSSNKLKGPLPHNISGLTFLLMFNMENNLITGRVPSWLFSLPSLFFLNLTNNRLTGPIDHIEKPSLILEEVFLSNNKISGTIPSSFFNLVSLRIVDLSSNNMTGEIPSYFNLTSLMDLNLANNSFRGKIPDCLGNLSQLKKSDLRLNEFHGRIPNSSVNNRHLQTLYLNDNQLGGRLPLSLVYYKSLVILDVGNNYLNDTFPHWLGVLPSLQVLTLQSNRFHGSMSNSENNLTGEIPSSLCSFSSLRVLDLAKNSLEGEIPECLGMFRGLAIMDLRMNKFLGRIPNSFVNNTWLRTLNLNGNQLEGRLPRSLVNCSFLEVLDVGNNYLNDTFPHWLGVLPSLQVLILQSNRFHGYINNSMTALPSFSQLRIIDISQNEFDGLLPTKYFQNFKAMRDVHPNKGDSKYIGDSSSFYEDSVKIVMKGIEVELVRILKIFTTIDFSSNQFHGPIPSEIGELNSLILLNLSHNSLNGQIPSSLGKLEELESLDLSSNRLDGGIPEQLTSLTFLSVLNLSYNELLGHIPEGKQFNTFSNDSYIGNSGLCGLPLTKKCHNEEDPGAPPSKFDEEDDFATLFNWKFALAGYGCGLVLGLSLGYIAFTIGKPWWVVKKVEKYQLKFVGRCTRRHKKRKTQKPNQCT